VTLAGARGTPEVEIPGPPMTLDLAGHLLLPGLINAHDHLEFNLFPRLSYRTHGNAGEWAREIYHPDQSPVREHLRVPKPVRLWWGALKNLLSGVTTVCHHNPYDPEFDGANFPVSVVSRFAWAHSLEFEPDVASRFREAPPDSPFLIHCGEGIDASARQEIDTLDSIGVLDNCTAIIHGVGLDHRLDLMRRRGASLIWCPVSNLLMFGRTVARDILRSEIPIALATDSAMSAPGDLLDALAAARRYLPVENIYDMISSGPRKILKLEPSALAQDWVAVLSDARSPVKALIEGSIALVVVRGKIRLVSPALARKLPQETVRDFQPLTLEGRPAVLVDVDVCELRRAAMRHLGPVLRLSGRRIET